MSRLLFPLLFCLGALGYFTRIFDGYFGPLTGPGDTDVAEHMGFLFSRMVTLWPWPRFHFETDLVFYPYGIMAGLQAWFPEREYWYWLATSLWGPGPWLNVYAFLSPLIAGLGAVWLLRKEFGTARAWVSGGLIAFFNFYAVHKYPAHFNIAMSHWTSLNLIYDFVLYRRVYREGRLTLREGLTRAVWILLALSQDLSYNAGFALASFTVTAVAIAWRLRAHRRIRELCVGWGREFAEHWKRCLSLLALMAALAWLYVPLAAQLFVMTRQYPVGGSGSYFASPLRWLVPWFPFFNPGTEWLARLGDKPEGLGAASPGWTLIVLAVLGLIELNRRKDRSWVPLAVFIGLCVLHHPQNFPVLKVFPWFGLMRVAGRSTVLFPVFLALLALFARWTPVRAAALLLVAALELVTAYGRFPVDQRSLPTAELWNYLERAHYTPGEALLDFPFCINAGNGVTAGLCPRSEAMGDYALQRFHEKKVVGLNFGRLTGPLAEPYLSSGWKFLYARNPERKSCLTPEEWEFFDHFYTWNGFAGIQLHRDLVGPDCAREIHARFGEPVASARLPGSGVAELIVKDPSRVAALDPARGRAMRYRPLLADREWDLLRGELPSSLAVSGLARAPSDEHWHAYTTAPSLTFYSPSDRNWEIETEVASAFPGQELTVWLNGQEISRTMVLRDHPLPLRVGVGARSGENVVEFRFSRRGGNTDVARAAWASGSLWPTAITELSRRHRNRPAWFHRLELRPTRPAFPR